jgi:hypothetical protein
MSHGAVMCVSVIGSPRCTSKSSRGCGGNGQYNTSVLLDCRGRRETVGVAALPGSAVMRTIPSIKTLLAHPWGLGSLRGRSTARRQRARGASVQRGSSFELTSFLYAARASCELPCRTARSISKRVVRRSRRWNEICMRAYIGMSRGLLLLLAVICCRRETTAFSLFPAATPAPSPPPSPAAALDIHATAIVSIARLQAAEVEPRPYPHLVRVLQLRPYPPFGQKVSLGFRAGVR